MRYPKQNKMAGKNSCFEGSITSTWDDFLLLMLRSSVVENTSCVSTETIILGDRSRVFTSISKNNCQLSVCFFSYLVWLEFAFPVSYSSTFVYLAGSINIDYFRSV